MKLKEWAREQGVSYRAALNWFHAGTLPAPARQLATGTILVEPAAVEQARTVAYCRVSRADQRDDPDRQAGRAAQGCARRGIALDSTVTEVGSGLNGNRPKLRKLLSNPAATTLVVEHRDRLARSGVQHLESALAAQSRRIIVLDSTEVADDLVRDVTEVLTSMCARLRLQRRAVRRWVPGREPDEQSQRWHHTQDRIRRLHSYVANARADGLHQLSTRLASEFDTIVVEDLNVAGMVRNRTLARAIAGVGMGELRRQLDYKTTWYGRELVTANRWFPSSKTCSACGVVKAKLRLSERTFTCDACGMRQDRDLNAARNLTSPDSPARPRARPCVDSAVTRYLVDGTVPESDAHCRPCPGLPDLASESDPRTAGQQVPRGTR